MNLSSDSAHKRSSGDFLAGLRRSRTSGSEDTSAASAPGAIKAVVRHNRVPASFDTYTLQLIDVDKNFNNETGTGLLTKDWNKSYHSAQVIFNGSAESVICKSMLHTAHNRLYTGTLGLTPTEKLTLTCGEDFLRMFNFGRVEQVTLPSVFTTAGESLSALKVVPFTYVLLESGVMRFSQTQHKDMDALLQLPSSVDFMSKHAVMADGAESVVYAGELFVLVRRRHHILVIDNGSGTYAPGDAHGELKRLEGLLVRNFPGLVVLAKVYNAPLTEDAIEAAIARHTHTTAAGEAQAAATQSA
eukprot:TRINITY_DN1889_c0_g1_i1.p1 TRINITY_DN1889_c0_g1~~TRINITY_DN1889_c0_g1_i1.p1  ORF type:complete len:301 (-),score=121.88 TRINITY_DN1889_c0_g1_i1:514-1416(-)